MLKPSFSAICLILFSHCSLLAQSAWNLKKTENEISIYSRTTPTTKFNELRVVTDLPGTLSGLRSILTDVDDYKGWVYSTEFSRLIETRSDSEIVYYSRICAPWPVSNRDFYSSTHIVMDSTGLRMRVSSSNIASYPAKDHLVRIPFLKADWVITVVSPYLLHVEYTLSWDPGGSIPAWVCNMFSTRGPYESFSQLKKKMALLPSRYAANK